MSRIWLCVLVVGLSATANAEPISSKAAKPPVAKKDPRSTLLHGDELMDDYFWMREKTSPEVIAYLEAENAYAEAVMKPTAKLQEALYKEMLGRIKQTDLSVPSRLGEHWYYTRTEEGKQYAIHCRKKGSLEGKEEVLLDLNLAAKDKKFLGLGAFVVSDDGRLLAYALDFTGYRDYLLFVKDLGSGEVLPDRVSSVETVVWAADNKTLFYVTEDKAKRPYRVWRHRLGGAKDDLIYEEKDGMYRVELGRSRDRAMIFISSASQTTTEARFLPSDRPGDEPALLLPREEGHEYHVEHRNGLFYFLSNKEAKNFRVATARVASPKSWEDLVKHDVKVSITSMDMFQDHLILNDRVDGLPGFRILDLKDGKDERMAFPEKLCQVAAENNPEFKTSKYRYTFQSFTSPQAVYEYDLTTREPALLKKTEVLGGYDPAKYTSERTFATASDGTKVPISLLYAKTTKLDGSAPMLLYGYGAYGSSMPIAFVSNRFSLVDRGGIFAIAHIRGGGEFGPLWHDQGKMLAKRNSFTDFIACADHVVKEKYTRRDRLVIEGRSAGGLLMGGVLTLRPDVARAVILGVPFVDAINSMLDLDMPLVIEEFLEWGNPRKPKEYAYMKTYCPYTNLKAQAYPSMLLTTSLNDSQVMYWEPAKYTAKLRTLKTDANPLLFKTNMAGGHGGSSGRYDYLREQAFIYAFLLNQMAIYD